MPFTLTEKDFETCKESKKTNYIYPVREKFDKELKPELVKALGIKFLKFMNEGRHPSPYAARDYTRYEGGKYRGNMWLGMALKEYGDPRSGTQLQFGIFKEGIFVCGVWFEDNATVAKKQAEEAISKNKPEFIRLLKLLGSSYALYARENGSKELNVDADKVDEENVDSWVQFLEKRSSFLDISYKMTKAEAIQLGPSIVSRIATVFEEILPIYDFLTGEPIEKDAELDIAVQQYKHEIRADLWKKEREEAYAKFREILKPANLPNLSKTDFVNFLNIKNNKSWTGLQRNQSKVTSDMEKLRRVLAYLQNDEIDVSERIHEVLDKQEGEFSISGFGPGLATAILLVCDMKDRYGVWNDRSENTLRRFKLIPEKLPQEKCKSYGFINDALNTLKSKYGLNLNEVDLFVYWADAYFRKAIMWSVNTKNEPDVIRNHQEQIKLETATLWGAGFTFRKDEFDLPYEIPLPLNGYLYEKGNKVVYSARVENIEIHEKEEPAKETQYRPRAYAEGKAKTFLKLSRLELLPQPRDITEFKSWKDGKKITHPPEGYYTIIDPNEIVIKPTIAHESSQQIVTKLTTEEPEYKEVIEVAIAHLLAGKNIVFYGAPATSKTYLAKKICEGVCGKANFQFHTANAEWSYFDIFGGLIPKGESYEFKKGLFLEACGDCFDSLEKNGMPGWLIIDELNRANLDLAFGKIFTQLDIDYRDKPLATIEGQECSIPFAFRVLATMNTYDKSVLFSLGYAFMRRFAFIPVRSLLKEEKGTPTLAIDQKTKDEIKIVAGRTRIKDLKERSKECALDHFSKTNKERNRDKAYVFDDLRVDNDKKIDEILASLKIGDFDVLDALLYVAHSITNEGLVEIGHAIIFDACKFVVAYSLLVKENTKPEKILDEAVDAYILPQLEYFMPHLRKGKVFSEEKPMEHWKKIRGILESLNLNKSSQKLALAEEEFRVIY